MSDSKKKIMDILIGPAGVSYGMRKSLHQPILGNGRKGHLELFHPQKILRSTYTIPSVDLKGKHFEKPVFFGGVESDIRAHLWHQDHHGECFEIDSLPDELVLELNNLRIKDKRNVGIISKLAKQVKTLANENRQMKEQQKYADHHAEIAKKVTPFIPRHDDKNKNKRPAPRAGMEETQWR